MFKKHGWASACYKIISRRKGSNNQPKFQALDNRASDIATCIKARILRIIRFWSSAVFAASRTLRPFETERIWRCRCHTIPEFDYRLLYLWSVWTRRQRSWFHDWLKRRGLQRKLLTHVRRFILCCSLSSNRPRILRKAAKELQSVLDLSPCCLRKRPFVQSPQLHWKKLESPNKIRANLMLRIPPQKPAECKSGQCWPIREARDRGFMH